MTEQDREWVRAMLEKVATEILYQGKEYCHVVVRGHAKDCPHVKKYKALAYGAFVGAGLAGVYPVSQLLKFLLGVM